MVNQNIAGRSKWVCPPYTVTEEKIREFTRAVRAKTSNSANPPTGNAPTQTSAKQAVVPPTFPIVLAEPALQLLAADPEAQIDFSRVVHGSQRFTYEKPLRPGENLTASLTVTSIKQLGGNTMLTAQTDMTDNTGVLAVRANSLLVIRGRETPVAPDTAATPAAAALLEDPLAGYTQKERQDDHPAGQGFTKLAELPAGTQLYTHEHPLTRDTLVRYAGASGDFNPIHYRDDYARSVGLEGVIAHGMLTFGVAATTVSDWLGTHGHIRDLQCKFTKQVPVPAAGHTVLHVKATLQNVNTQNREITIALHVENAGNPVLGRALVVASFA